jgi:hypothetical protein
MKKLAFLSLATLVFAAACNDVATSPLAPSDAAFKKGRAATPEICADRGDWQYDAEAGEWTAPGEGGNLNGSVKIDVSGFDGAISAPSGYLVSGYCYKAGLLTELVVVAPPAASIVIETANAKDISHFSVSLVQDPGFEQAGEWCSPGFWRNNYDKHGASAWPTPVADFANRLYSTIGGSPVKAGAPSNATLIDVLSAPQTFGGAAYNSVGTYLSLAVGLDVTDPIVHNCPINQQGQRTN